MKALSSPVTMRLAALACIAVMSSLSMQAMADSERMSRSLVPRHDLPLHGKTILFTLPRNYAGRLGRLMIEHGARPVWMPTIVIEPMADYREFDRALRNRDEYEWIAFTSRNGIEAFFSRMDALGLEPADFANVKIAAIGNDGRALEQGGIKPDLVPSVPSPQGIADELAERGSRGTVLVPVPDVIGMEEPRVVPDFIAALEEVGLTTRRVPAYVTAKATEGLSVGTVMLREGEIDMIAFASRGEVESLLLHLGDERSILDGNAAVACFGPITAAGARKRNIRVDVVATDYSRFEGFIEAMEQYFKDEAR